MKRPKIEVIKRELLGKKIKKLRKDGILPANIYGKDIKSQAVQLPLKAFETIFKEVGKTGLLDVMVDGTARPALIHNVQVHPVTGLPLHIDFYQVNLKEKITTMVPVVITGEAKAVTEKIGLLMTPATEVEVEALPEDLPENIEINVEPLAAIDEQITVGDLKLPAGVTVLTDAGQVLVKVAELVSKEAEELAAQVAAEAEAAAAEAAPTEEGAEGEPSSAEATDGEESETKEEGKGKEEAKSDEPSSAKATDGKDK